MSSEFRIFTAASSSRPEPIDLLEAIRSHVAKVAATKFVRNELRNKHHVALAAPPQVTPETSQSRAASNTVPDPLDLAAAIRAARSQE